MKADADPKAFVPAEAVFREDKGARVVVSRDGPLVVEGSVPLRLQVITPNKEGFSWDWVPGKSFKVGETYALCRCGNSQNKPFCDGSHTRARFDGTETASRRPLARQAEHTPGPTMSLDDVEGLCAFARFCDPGGKIWSLIEQTDDPEVCKLVIREAAHCPSGRLVVHDNKSPKPSSRSSSRPSASSRTPPSHAAAPCGSKAASPSSRRTASATRYATASRYAAAASRPTSRSATAATPASASTTA